MAELLTILIIGAVLFLLSALPLYLAVKVMAGHTTLIKTALISLVAGIILAIIKALFTTWGSMIAFIVLILIYKNSFGLGWIRALIAWLLQFVFIVALYFVALAVLGISIVAMVI